MPTPDQPVPRLDARLRFPDPRSRRPGRAGTGLVATGGDLSVQRLLLAYRSGIFPWTDDPITWWSPDPRAIIEFDRLHIPASLARTLHRHRFETSYDRAFTSVIQGCAAPARGRETTWITPSFIEAYTQLHRQGHAHSIECWRGDELAGGVYGVAVGGFFAGESMFHRVTDASKVALVHLAMHLRERGFTLFDIQMLTPVTRRLGGVEIAREEYLERLAEAVSQPCRF